MPLHIPQAVTLWGRFQSGKSAEAPLLHDTWSCAVSVAQLWVTGEARPRFRMCCLGKELMPLASPWKGRARAVSQASEELICYL